MLIAFKFDFCYYLNATNLFGLGSRKCSKHLSTILACMAGVTCRFGRRELGRLDLKVTPAVCGAQLF